MQASFLPAPRRMLFTKEEAIKSGWEVREKLHGGDTFTAPRRTTSRRPQSREAAACVKPVRESYKPEDLGVRRVLSRRE